MYNAKAVHGRRAGLWCASALGSGGFARENGVALEDWVPAFGGKAEGDVAKFKAIVKEYTKAKDVTKERLYLEAMEEILPGINKYVVPNGEDGNLLNLLNLNGMRGEK